MKGRILDHPSMATEQWREGVLTRMLVSAVTGAAELCIFEQFCDPGSGAPMHYHGDAINFLAWGRKEWFLQPPAAAEYSTAAAVDFVAHELPGLRREGRAPLQCSQAAGDALYVPRGWGHAVLNLNTSVGWVVEFSTAMRRY